jgi:hypothetical protein
VIFPEDCVLGIGEILEVTASRRRRSSRRGAGGRLQQPFLVDIGPGSLDGFLFLPGTNSSATRSRAMLSPQCSTASRRTSPTDQLEGQPLTWREAVAVAAIVQREAVVEEAPIIAAVFLNRLEVGLRCRRARPCSSPSRPIRPTLRSTDGGRKVDRRPGVRFAVQYVHLAG